MKVQYDYYFRIEYRIVQGVCQPLDMFNTTETINSLQKMVQRFLILIFQIIFGFFFLD